MIKQTEQTIKEAQTHDTGTKDGRREIHMLVLDKLIESEVGKTHGFIEQAKWKEVNKCLYRIRSYETKKELYDAEKE